MPIFITFPEQGWIDNEQITAWYDTAVEHNLVRLGLDRANNIEEMAEALDDAGIISLGKPLTTGD